MADLDIPQPVSEDSTILQAVPFNRTIDSVIADVN